jgi:hypothetical protein
VLSSNGAPRKRTPAAPLLVGTRHSRPPSDAYHHRPGRPTRSEENPITAFSGSREIVDAFETALNAKDAEALGELFAEDAEFVNIVGMRMRRREGIVAGHAWAFGGPLGGMASFATSGYPSRGR